MGKCYTIVNNAQNDLIDFTRYTNFKTTFYGNGASTWFGNGVYGVRAWIIEKNLNFFLYFKVSSSLHSDERLVVGNPLTQDKVAYEFTRNTGKRLVTGSIGKISNENGGTLIKPVK